MVSTHIQKKLFARAVRLGIEDDLGKIVNEMLANRLDELEKGK